MDPGIGVFITACVSALSLIAVWIDRTEKRLAEPAKLKVEFLDHWRQAREAVQELTLDEKQSLRSDLDSLIQHYRSQNELSVTPLRYMPQTSSGWLVLANLLVFVGILAWTWSSSGFVWELIPIAIPVVLFCVVLILTLPAKQSGPE